MRIYAVGGVGVRVMVGVKVGRGVQVAYTQRVEVGVRVMVGVWVMVGEMVGEPGIGVSVGGNEGEGVREMVAVREGG